MKKTLIIAAIFLSMTSCKDAEIAQWKSMGSKHRVTVWSGGKPVAVFHSTGNISNEDKSDGWYFEDASTHKLVEVTGTIIIEQE